MARIRTPLLRPGMRLRDLRADEFNEAFSAGQHFANMRVGEGLAFKFSPVGGAMLTLTRRERVVGARPLLRVRAKDIGGDISAAEVKDDTLIVERNDGTTLEIAKPLLLQTQNYGDKTRKFLRAGGDIATASVSVFYPAIDALPSSRIAQVTSIGGNNEPGTADFLEAITSPYAVGDPLVAELVGVAITGVAGVPWMDTNNDGRHWAEGFAG